MHVQQQQQAIWSDAVTGYFQDNFGIVLGQGKHPVYVR
jgi:hypothetical protein